MTGRALGVTGLLALGALVKPPAAVALAVWLVAVGLDGPRRDRLRVIAGHLGVAAALGAAVTAPFFAGAHTVATFGTLAGVQGWASPARLVGRGAEALGDLVAAGLGDALRTAALAGFLALFAWGALRLLGRTGHLRLETQAPGHWAAGLLLFALAAPYLLPWYAAWFVPLLPLLAEGGLVAIGLAAAGVLALTGVPAEPGSAPALYRGMLLAVHYVAAPAMLVLFALALRRVTGPPFRTMAAPVPHEAGQEPIDARPRPGP